MKRTKEDKRRKRALEGTIRDTDERNGEMKQGRRDDEKMRAGRKLNGEYYVGKENKKGRDIRGKEGKGKGEKGDRRGR